MFPHTTLRRHSNAAPLVAITPGGHVIQYRQKSRSPVARSRSLSPSKEVRGTMTSPMDLHFKTTSQVLASTSALRHTARGQQKKTESDDDVQDTSDLSSGSASSPALNSSSSDAGTEDNGENTPQASGVETDISCDIESVIDKSSTGESDPVGLNKPRLSDSSLPPSELNPKLQDSSSKAISRHLQQSYLTAAPRTTQNGSVVVRSRRTTFVICSASKDEAETIQYTSSNKPQPGKTQTAIQDSITQKSSGPAMDILHPKTASQHWGIRHGINAHSTALTASRTQPMPLLGLCQKSDNHKSSQYVARKSQELPSRIKTTATMVKRLGNASSGERSPDLPSTAVTTAAFGKRLKRIHSLETIGSHNNGSTSEDRFHGMNNQKSAFRPRGHVNSDSKANGIPNLAMSRFSCVQITKADIRNATSSSTGYTPVTSTAVTNTLVGSPINTGLRASWPAVRPTLVPKPPPRPPISAGIPSKLPYGPSPGANIHAFAPPLSPAASVNMQIASIPVGPSPDVTSAASTASVNKGGSCSPVDLLQDAPKRYSYRSSHTTAHPDMLISTTTVSIIQNPGKGQVASAHSGDTSSAVLGPRQGGTEGLVQGTDHNEMTRGN